MKKSEKILEFLNSTRLFEDEIKEFGEIKIGTIFSEMVYEEDGSWYVVYCSLVSVEDRLFLIQCDENGELQEDMENFNIDEEMSLNEMTNYWFNETLKDLTIYKNNLQDQEN